ncbi:ABC transporter substrate-binding protein [soil metagenome]
MYKIIFLIFLTLLFFGCSNRNEQQRNRSETLFSADVSEDHFEHKITVDYAQGFKVEYFPNYKLVTIPEPWRNAPRKVQYLLVQKGTPIPEHQDDIQVIQIPLQSIASLSTTHIPLLELLNVHHTLTGFSNTDYISSSKVRELVDAKQVKDLGPDGSLNLEVLLDLQPEILMAFGTGSNTGLINKINKMGIPVVLNADYLEQSSLGRSEWIKFASLFYNKEKEADSIFNSIRHNYDSLKLLAKEAPISPKVFSGIVYGDIWFMPGGQSWAAELLADANADFLWKENNSKGSIELSFENVYAKASDADFWIGVASFNSLEEMARAEPRYKGFEAHRKEKVYSYNARIGEKGGNEYMELGYARPDIILADLIKILHPHLLPDHQLYFYKKLPKSGSEPNI